MLGIPHLFEQDKLVLLLCAVVDLLLIPGQGDTKMGGDRGTGRYGAGGHGNRRNKGMGALEDGGHGNGVTWEYENGGHGDSGMETAGMGAWQQGGHGYMETLGQGDMGT